MANLRGNPGSGGRVLPPGGYRGPIPEWPLPSEPSPEIMERWEALWRMPQAAAWVEMGSAPTVARYVLAERAALDSFAGGRSNGALLAEVRQVENTLGISPAGMRALGWVIGKPKAEKSEEPTTVRSRVRAVD